MGSSLNMEDNHSMLGINNMDSNLVLTVSRCNLDSNHMVNSHMVNNHMVNSHHHMDSNHQHMVNNLHMGNIQLQLQVMEATEIQISSIQILKEIKIRYKNLSYYIII